MTASEPHPGRVAPLDLARVALVLAAAAAVWVHVWEPFARVSAIGVVALAVGAYPIFREAFENVVERRMTMELSMSIALVAALSIGQALTALVIAAFVLAAEILEDLTVSRGRRAIGDLVRYLPQTARVRRDGTILDLPASELVPGDAVLVDPGALVPVDGAVVAGHSFVDESRITGEAMPAEKRPGARAFAGTLNQSGALEIDAERLGRDTSFGQIVEAVESAERTRAPAERLADRLAGWLVSFALGAALLTYLLTRNIVATISVVIVAGACGIAAGTPLAILGAIGRAARVGAIVKGGRYIEALAETSVVVFDKTGTLTYGKPEIREVRPCVGVAEGTLVALAASAEMRSEHPLGRALVAYAATVGLALEEPETFAYTPGRGIRARVAGVDVVVGNAVFLREEGIAGGAAALAAASDATNLLVASDGAFLGAIAVADRVRPEAAGAVAALRALGIRTVVLTGDVRGAAAAVASALGIEDFEAELLPEEKRAYVAALVASGQSVAMVGDGVNDAPALIAANVGVAMGSGTDVARDSADVVLLGNDLMRLIAIVSIARRTKAIVMQNFVGTLLVDALGIALAAVGILTPLPAAFVHVASELAFILNATRMLAPPESRVR